MLRISRRKLIAAVLIAAAAVVLGIAAYLHFRTGTYATVRFHMDTYISYYVGGRKAESAVEEMDAAVQECEDLFSRFDAGSEISAVNANAGAFTEVSEETYLLISEALSLSARTEGCFDPTVGALLDLWGFGTEPHVPDQADIDEALPCVGYGKVMLREDGGRYLVSIGEGQKLDLGGIAKGYALRKVREVYERCGCSFAVVSFGGNVLLCGSGHDGRDGFSVGIRTPEAESAESAVILSLDGGVVSTSGSYERFFEEDSVRYCHIMDPFTGRCAEGGMLSVSVICDDPVEADCLSTAYFVRGLDSTLDALASGEISGLAIDASGTVYISADLYDRLIPEGTAEGYRIEVVG